MLVTPDGIVTLCKLVHWKNKLAAMKVMPLGKTISVRLVQKLNAPSPMLVIVGGNVMLLNFWHP